MNPMNYDDADRTARAIVYGAARMAEAVCDSRGGPIGEGISEEITRQIVMQLTGEAVTPFVTIGAATEEGDGDGPSLFDDDETTMLYQPTEADDAEKFRHEELIRAVGGMAEEIGKHEGMMEPRVLERLREAHRRLFVATAQVITAREVHVSESPMDTLRLLGRRFDGPPVPGTATEDA